MGEFQRRIKLMAKADRLFLISEEGALEIVEEAKQDFPIHTKRFKQKYPKVVIKERDEFFERWFS